MRGARVSEFFFTKNQNLKKKKQLFFGWWGREGARVRTALLLLKDNKSMHKCTSYGPDKLNI